MKRHGFADVLDAAGSLPIDEREELIDLLSKQTIEERRTELNIDIKNARAAHKLGKTKAASADAIMREILS
jgi:hypothetical protein